MNIELTEAEHKLIIKAADYLYLSLWGKTPKLVEKLDEVDRQELINDYARLLNKLEGEPLIGE